jgi:ribulose-bisphosphate carboxylase large chain
MVAEKILVHYELTPQQETIERCVELLLNEMTSGIQYFSSRDGVVMDQVRGHVPYVDSSALGEVAAVEEQGDGSFRVVFSLPVDNIDPSLGGITNLWPVVAGEVFNFYFIKRARLVDLELPVSLRQRYLGPRFGIRAIRSLVRHEGTPLVGAIIKPNVGLNPRQAAKLAEDLAYAGFDFLKDDEISVSPALCPLKERVGRIADAVEKASRETGRKMLYIANITSDFSVLHEAACTARDAGAGGFMIDPFCIGLSAIDFLRRSFALPVYLHRVGYGLFTAGPAFSISYEAFSRLFRLLGADFSHVGGIWGSSAHARNATKRYLEILRAGDQRSGDCLETWPVVSGISLENIGDYYGFYGDDTLILDHIDIYNDRQSAAKKREALAARMAAARDMKAMH